jgi:dTDP-4-dehydrorhamnose 3,5-epimerase
MIFTDTRLVGAFLITVERHKDERGFFGRSWCRQEFEQHGLNNNLVQCNISFNNRRGTLRGMHYQTSPFQEAKLIRCTMGAIYDVIVDLRPQSKTFRHWLATILNAENRSAIYVPEGFAHGFQTLIDNTEVFYQMSEFYLPEAAKGVRWNDPTFGIEWPIEKPILSKKDKNYPDWGVS